MMKDIMATAGVLEENRFPMDADDAQSQERQERMEGIPADLMTKCPSCGVVLVTKDWLRDLKVCSRCGHHVRLGAHERIDLLCDPDSFQEWDSHLLPRDPLQFPGYKE